MAIETLGTTTTDRTVPRDATRGTFGRGSIGRFTSGTNAVREFPRTAVRLTAVLFFVMLAAGCNSSGSGGTPGEPTSQSALSLSGTIGTNADAAAGTTTVLTVPAGGVAAGSTIIVTFASEPGTIPEGEEILTP